MISAIVRGDTIQLEERVEEGTSLYGYTIVPGGTIKEGETEGGALRREVEEEYGVEITAYKRLGMVNDSDGKRMCFRHVFLVTEWTGNLTNPENRNNHIEVSLCEARRMCNHKTQQLILDLVEAELSG